MILHLDGDNFFVSCELLRRRDLRGKAVVVGEERGIATAMNIEAKKLGITRGMPVYMIRQKWSADEVPVLPSHFELYRQLGTHVLRILEKYSTQIEAYSVDENFAYLPHPVNPKSTFQSPHYFSAEKCASSRASRAPKMPSKCLSDYEDLSYLAHTIQKDIFECTGLWYSCGIARTKALAKIASKRNKPQGVCVIMLEDESHVLDTTPIENVWGIGRRLTPKMKARGIHTGREYRDASRMQLSGIDDKWVLELQDELKGVERYHLGRSDRPFQKSVETTRAFGCSSIERSFVLSEFSKNVETVCGRLVQLGVAAQYVYFFIRTKNKYRIYGESELSHPTQNVVDVLRVVQKKFETLVDAHLSDMQVTDHGIMGTGITMSECIPSEAITRSLFDSPHESHTQANTFDRHHSDLQMVIESLRDRHGSGIIQMASSVHAHVRRTESRQLRSERDTDALGGEYIYGLPLPYLGEVL